MSKKNFIALADAIREHNRVFANRGDRAQIFTAEQLATLAEFCGAQNSAFKRELWINYVDGACGPNGGTVAQYRGSVAQS